MEEEGEQKFCQLLVEEATIKIDNEFLLLQPMGMKGRKIQLSSLDDKHEKKDKIRTLIDALEKVQYGELLMKSRIGLKEGEQIISVVFDFQEPEPIRESVKVLNKRDWGKRKRSSQRNPTPPKDESKAKNWRRIHT